MYFFIEPFESRVMSMTGGSVVVVVCSVVFLIVTPSMRSASSLISVSAILLHGLSTLYSIMSGVRLAASNGL